MMSPILPNHDMPSQTNGILPVPVAKGEEDLLDEHGVLRRLRLVGQGVHGREGRSKFEESKNFWFVLNEGRFGRRYEDREGLESRQEISSRKEEIRY
jgi:hypothetical protein